MKQKTTIYTHEELHFECFRSVKVPQKRRWSDWRAE
jgi:hypothetical protein